MKDTNHQNKEITPMSDYHNEANKLFAFTETVLRDLMRGDPSNNVSLRRAMVENKLRKASRSHMQNERLFREGKVYAVHEEMLSEFISEYEPLRDFESIVFNRKYITNNGSHLEFSKDNLVNMVNDYISQRKRVIDTTNVLQNNNNNNEGEESGQGRKRHVSFDINAMTSNPNIDPVQTPIEQTPPIQHITKQEIATTDSPEYQLTVDEYVQNSLKAASINGTPIDVDQLKQYKKPYIHHEITSNGTTLRSFNDRHSAFQFYLNGLVNQRRERRNHIKSNESLNVNNAIHEESAKLNHGGHHGHGEDHATSSAMDGNDNNTVTPIRDKNNNDNNNGIIGIDPIDNANDAIDKSSISTTDDRLNVTTDDKSIITITDDDAGVEPPTKQPTHNKQNTIPETRSMTSIKTQTNGILETETMNNPLEQTINQDGNSLTDKTIINLIDDNNNPTPLSQQTPNHKEDPTIEDTITTQSKEYQTQRENHLLTKDNDNLILGPTIRRPTIEDINLLHTESERSLSKSTDDISIVLENKNPQVKTVGFADHIEVINGISQDIVKDNTSEPTTLINEPSIDPLKKSTHDLKINNVNTNVDNSMESQSNKRKIKFKDYPTNKRKKSDSKEDLLISIQNSRTTIETLLGSTRSAISEQTTFQKFHKFKPPSPSEFEISKITTSIQSNQSMISTPGKIEELPLSENEMKSPEKEKITVIKLEQSNEEIKHIHDESPNVNSHMSQLMCQSNEIKTNPFINQNPINQIHPIDDHHHNNNNNPFLSKNRLNASPMSNNIHKQTQTNTNPHQNKHLSNIHDKSQSNSSPKKKLPKALKRMNDIVSRYNLDQE